MKVINLGGPPGCGKTTTGLGLAFNMKKIGLNVVFVQEYAQELVNENRTNALQDQLYILAKQNRRLARLVGQKYDFVISDSPLFTGLLYTPPDYLKSFEPVLMELFNSYDNYNYVLSRDHSRVYNPVGRNQKTLQDALVIDKKLEEMLDRLSISHTVYPASDAAIALILAEHGYE